MQNIIKVFKYLFKNRNSKHPMTTKFRPMGRRKLDFVYPLDEIYKFRPTGRRKLAGPTKIVLFMHFRLPIRRNYISSNDWTIISYFRPLGRRNLDFVCWADKRGIFLKFHRSRVLFRNYSIILY